MTCRIRFQLLCSLGALLPIANAAHADDMQVNQAGQICVGNPTGTVYYSGPGGAYNSFTTQTLPVTCPLTYINVSTSANTFDASRVVVAYMDMNSATTSAGLLSCALSERDASGNLYYQAAKYSCATTGGCASSATNNFTATRGFLDLYTPASGNYDNVSVNCTLPTAVSGNLSGIVGIHTTYSNNP